MRNPLGARLFDVWTRRSTTMYVPFLFQTPTDTIP